MVCSQVKRVTFDQFWVVGVKNSFAVNPVSIHCYFYFLYFFRLCATDLPDVLGSLGRSLFEVEDPGVARVQDLEEIIMSNMFVTSWKNASSNIFRASLVCSVISHLNKSE